MQQQSTFQTSQGQFFSTQQQNGNQTVTYGNSNGYQAVTCGNSNGHQAVTCNNQLRNGNPQTQIISTNPQHYSNSVIIQPAPQGRSTGNSDKLVTPSIVLGFIQMVMGVIAIITNVVILLDAYQTRFSFRVHGIWGGMFWVIVGAIGILCGVSKMKSCQVATCLVMNILALCFATPNMFIVAALDVVFIVVVDEDENLNTVGLAMESVMLVLAVMYFVVGIICVVVCSMVMCCGQSHAQPGKVWTTNTVLPTAPQTQAHYTQSSSSNGGVQGGILYDNQSALYGNESALNSTVKQAPSYTPQAPGHSQQPESSDQYNSPPPIYEEKQRPLIE